MIFQQATEAKKGTGGFCPTLLTDGSALASGAAARAGVTTTLAAAGDLAAVMVFETATFPSRARWFHAGNGDALLAPRRWPGAACAEVAIARTGQGCGWEGGRRSPSSGGTSGGAGGGGAGGWPKEAETSASNSSRSHSGSAQIRSADAVSASYVARSMPITLPGTCGSAARSMTDTLFI